MLMTFHRATQRTYPCIYFIFDWSPSDSSSTFFIMVVGRFLYGIGIGLVVEPNILLHIVIDISKHLDANISVRLMCDAFIRPCMLLRCILQRLLQAR
jgi:hypothetical protein